MSRLHDHPESHLDSRIVSADSRGAVDAPLAEVADGYFATDPTSFRGCKVG